MSYHLYPGKDLIMGSIKMEIPIIVLIEIQQKTIVSHYYYIKNGVNIRTTLTPEYFGPARSSLMMTGENFSKHYHAHVYMTGGWKSLIA